MGKRVPFGKIDVDMSIVETPQERYQREDDEKVMETFDRTIRKELHWLDEGTPWSEGWDEN